MIGVALDFGRPAIVRLDQKPGHLPGQRHDSCIEIWMARNVAFNALGNWIDMLNWAAAGGKSSQAERGGHQLQHRASRAAVHFDRIDRRKLALEKRTEFRSIRKVSQAAPVFWTAP